SVRRPWPGGSLRSSPSTQSSNPPGLSGAPDTVRISGPRSPSYFWTPAHKWLKNRASVHGTVVALRAARTRTEQPMITFPLIAFLMTALFFAAIPVVAFALMLETVRARAPQGRVVEIEAAPRTLRF